MRLSDSMFEKLLLMKANGGSSHVVLEYNSSTDFRYSYSYAIYTRTHIHSQCTRYSYSTDEVETTRCCRFCSYLLEMQ